MDHAELVAILVQKGHLKAPGIIAAFREIGRADFMRKRTTDLACVESPIPIGYGQTISQPSIVALMLELLQPQPGQTILDIGSGSGWTSALLARIVGRGGKVTAVELIPELREFGERNAAKYDPEGIIEFFCGDASKGWPERAPYDGILVSAGAKKLPPELIPQLRIGGRVVLPIGNSICQFIKTSEEALESIECRGYVFVPLLDEHDIRRREEAKKFLAEDLLHRCVAAVIAARVAQNVPSSTVQIAESVNSLLAQGGSQLSYSTEQVAAVVSRLTELGFIAPTLMLTISAEETSELVRSLFEELPMSG